MLKVFAGAMAVAMAFGPIAAKPAQAETRTSFSLGIGIGGGPVYGGYRGYYGRPRPYWGPRPAWYGAGWYRPYYAPGSSFNFYASFPVTTVRRWREPVRVYHRDAYRAALLGPVGEAYGWDDGYDYGSVTATRDGYSGDTYCREFLQEVTIGGEREQAYGTACQNPDGSWRQVQGNP